MSEWINKECVISQRQLLIQIDEPGVFKKKDTGYFQDIYSSVKN